LAAGTYPAGQTITITDATPGATIYYTQHGEMPSTLSAKYTGPISLSSGGIFRAIAGGSQFTTSAVASAAYSILVTPAVPTFSPGPGTYAYGQKLTLSDATPGVAIYYTLDGTIPSSASLRYSTPILLDGSKTVTAIAVYGVTNSGVAKATYVLTTPAPVLTPPNFVTNSTRNVTISDALSSAAIYYTTDGTVPTTASTHYTTAIAVSQTKMVNAIAVAPGYAPSPATSGAFVVRLIYAIAGNGGSGYSGDGGPAVDASFYNPAGIAFDAAGNLYVADEVNGCIRVIAGDTGIITTFAGPCVKGSLGDPSNIAFDSGGNLYFSDSVKNIIEKIAVGTGVISTIAGVPYREVDGFNPKTNGKYSGDGGPATSAGLFGPSGLTFDSQGNLYFADGGNNVVRKIAASTGIITTVAGNGYGADGGYDSGGYGGDGGPATQAELNGPSDVAFDSNGNFYIADSNNGLIRKVEASSGVISTYAGNPTATSTTPLGDKGPATSAFVDEPISIALDSANNLYILEYGDWRVRLVTASTGIITTAAGNGQNGIEQNGVPPTQTSIDSAFGVTLDSAGNLYVLERLNGKVRKISLSAAPGPTF
jgi:sugar lactone lactonase YvrE